MVDFPNCKINLGLNVIEKRTDGFHNIETVFYPVNWCDALEIIEGGQEPFQLFSYGLKVDGVVSDNIIFKAWQSIANRFKIPPIQVHLYKNLPMGAGLGGGSSNAAYFVKLLNSNFKLGLSKKEMIEYIRPLGSDCAFFIENKPLFAQGKGDELSPINLNLKGYVIALIYPKINSKTEEAYKGIIPFKPTFSVKDIVENYPIEKWKEYLFNDFEKNIFKRYPEIEAIKNLFYENGAIYAAMSGSGSAVFGIFEKSPNIKPSNLWFYFESIL